MVSQNENSQNAAKTITMGNVPGDQAGEWSHPHLFAVQSLTFGFFTRCIWVIRNEDQAELEP